MGAVSTTLLLMAMTFVVMFVNFILPTINLHLILNRELSLEQQAQTILDAARYADIDAIQSVMGLEIDGIEIEDVITKDIADYTVYSIYFHHAGLFLNDNLKNAELYQQKIMSVVTDKE